MGQAVDRRSGLRAELLTFKGDDEQPLFGREIGKLKVTGR